MLCERKKTRAWLIGPVPSLGGRRPIDLLKSEIGTAQVERALVAIGYGGVA
jgi:uncharacterized protein (DUF2384 family)